MGVPGQHMEHLVGVGSLHAIPAFGVLISQREPHFGAGRQIFPQKQRQALIHIWKQIVGDNQVIDAGFGAMPVCADPKCLPKFLLHTLQYFRWIMGENVHEQVIMPKNQAAGERRKAAPNCQDAPTKASVLQQIPIEVRIDHPLGQGVLKPAMRSEDLVAGQRGLLQPAGNSIVGTVLGQPRGVTKHYVTECPELRFELWGIPSGNRGHDQFR